MKYTIINYIKIVLWTAFILLSSFFKMQWGVFNYICLFIAVIFTELTIIALKKQINELNNQ